MSLKRSERIRNSVIWIMVLCFLVLLMGDVLGMFLFPTIDPVKQPYAFTFMAYASFITIWISVLFVIYAFKKNRYIKEEVVKNTKGNTFKNLMIGLLAGFVLNGFCALIAMQAGSIQVQFKTFDFVLFIGLIIAVFIQSSAEEVLCRGFLYQRILESKSKYWIAILLNSAFFGILHLFNDGINVLAFYDLIITGVFFSLVVFYFDSLWMAMGIHTGWNFTQSILLGLPNSGTNFPYSIFQLNPAVHGGFAYNVEFGLEGTILSSIMMTVCCIVLYVWKNKEKNIWQSKSTKQIEHENASC